VQADVDYSGTIEYEEFIAATIHLNKLECEENLIAAFQYFDKDGNGYITVDELQQACPEHKLHNMTVAYLEHIEDIIRDADQDHVSHLNLFLLIRELYVSKRLCTLI
jgi:calcium-dependent protein kinase